MSRGISCPYVNWWYLYCGVIVVGRGSYPGSVDWMALAEAARVNSGSLLGDAEIMLANNSPARSYSMAVLGLEELGKYYMCLGVQAGIADPADVWRKLSLHGPKLEQVASAVALFGNYFNSTGLADQLEKFVAHESSSKMRGMYVDWDGERVAEPSEVPIAAAREVVELLRELVAFVKVQDLTLMASNLAEVDTAAFMEEMRAGAHQLDEHLKTLDPEDAAAVKQKFLDDLVATFREIIRAEGAEGS